MGTVPARLNTSQHEQAAERLLELGATYLQVTALPDDVEALRRQVGELNYSLMRLCVLVDRIGERLERLERRERMRGVS